MENVTWCISISVCVSISLIRLQQCYSDRLTIKSRALSL